MVMADFDSYVICQDRAGIAYQDRAHWNEMSILNVARMGKFSSDRSIQDYASNIWKVTPTPVEI